MARPWGFCWLLDTTLFDFSQEISINVKVSYSGIFDSPSKGVFTSKRGVDPDKFTLIYVSGVDVFIA